MHGGDRGCPVTRDGRTRPRQGREGLGPGRVRRTPRGRTARTRLWALTLDRGVPSPAPGGKVTHSLHGRLCSADAQGEGAAGREGPRPPATSRVGEAVPSCRGGRAPGLRPAWGHRPLERHLGLPVSRGTTTVSGLPAKQCARGGCGGRRGRAGRVRTPGLPPAGVRAHPGGAEGAAGLGSLEGAEQTPFSSSPATAVPSPAAAGSSGQRWSSRPEGGGGRRDGRGPPRALHGPGWWSEAGAPGGLPHATLTSVPGHTHARPLRG